MIHVAIDESPLVSGHAARGIGVHTKELIQGINDLENESVKLEVVDFISTDLSKYDLVHYPFFHPFFPTLPRNCPTKLIVTIHDLIQLIYPIQYSPGLKGKLRYLKQKQLIKKVDGIVTISETSKKDIIRFLNINPQKIKVINLAPKTIYKKLSMNPTFVSEIRKKHKLPSKFVLYVGDINYNKNIPNLISACKIIKIPLVIVGKQALEIESAAGSMKNLSGPRDWIRFLIGKPHPEIAHYSKLLSEFENNTNIIRTGFAADEELVAIYNLAAVYCQPSLYEGFGFPVLEAMACETPAVVARTNALVEIAGDAALVADPEDPKDIGNKIKLVLSNRSLANDLIEKGKKRVKMFSWKKTAQETIDFYRQVLNG